MSIFRTKKKGDKEKHLFYSPIYLFESVLDLPLGQSLKYMASEFHLISGISIMSLWTLHWKKRFLSYNNLYHNLLSQTLFQYYFSFRGSRGKKEGIFVDFT